MMQAIRATRPGGHVGFVGVLHDVEIPGEEFFSPTSTCTEDPPRFAASFPSWST
jgi:threonine dehydrogenase-like Zn-dependent dehydrogenase